LIKPIYNTKEVLQNCELFIYADIEYIVNLLYENLLKMAST